MLAASPLSAQVVSVKTSLPVFTGAPGILSFQAPALSPGLSAPAFASGLTPSLVSVLAALLGLFDGAAAAFDAKNAEWAEWTENPGRTPGGFELFLAPGLAVNWDAARELNEALHAKKP